MELREEGSEGSEGSDAAAPLALQPGALVDCYRVVRLVGRGGFAQVYQARDLKLGRKVALKLLDSTWFGSPRAVQRFLFEARATAQFSHPNIVAIYGVGEHEGNPYVALEYLEGHTLRERMAEAPPTPRESLRIALAIAEALAEAHSRKILHGDLKPENVLIPADGRPRLVDFGLAKPLPAELPDVAHGFLPGERTAMGVGPGADRTQPGIAPEPPEHWLAAHGGPGPRSSDGNELRGTPHYMAPEQWLQGQPTAATDIWALGVLLHELLAGAQPFNAPTIVSLMYHICSADPAPPLPAAVQVPQDLRELVAACLSKKPGDRPQTAEVVDRLEQMVYRRRKFVAEGASPFPGLMPYGERFCDLFFGRDAETSLLLERLRTAPVLPVVGPSGSGKSSFVEAAVIPRVKELDLWLVLRARPGARPFFNLALALVDVELPDPKRPSTGPEHMVVPAHPAREDESQSPRHRRAAALAAQLEQTPSLLGMLLNDLAEQRQCRVLLFVDQLEEIYSLLDDPKLQRDFFDAICGAADATKDPVRVLFAFRDDYLGRVAGTPRISEVLGQVFVLRNPGPAALREILLKPAEVAGYDFEEAALVEEMVAAVEGEPACLPLLQFAMRALWEGRDTQRRLFLRETYDTMGGLAGALAEHAESVLEGFSPGQVGLSRELMLRLVTSDGDRRTLSRPMLIEGLGPEGSAVLDRLVQARLVLAGKGREDESAEAELELVHESLIRRWPRFARWLDESRGEWTVLADLAQAAALWEKRGQPPDELWQGPALQEGAQAVKRSGRRVSRQIRRFLQASWAREQRQRRRRVIVRAAGVVLLGLVAFGAVLAALALAAKEREASAQRERAVVERGEALREAAWAAVLRGETLDARAKLRAAFEVGDSASARALWWRMAREPLVCTRTLAGPVFDVALSPDGRTVAAASQDRTIYLFDIKTQSMRLLRGHRDQVHAVAFSPDGSRLASGTWSGEVGIWDLPSRRMRVLAGHTGKITTLAFSRDGRRLASSAYDGTVRLWDTSSDRPGQVLRGHGGRVHGVAFMPDGARVASAGADKTVRLWDVRTGATVRVLEGHADRVSAVAVSPDGRMLASAAADRTVRLWGLPDGQVLRLLEGHAAEVQSVAFNADGRHLVSGGNDRTVRVWETASGREVHTLRGHTEWVYRVAFSPRRDVVASASGDHSIRIWNLSHVEDRRAATGQRGRVFGAAFSPDGRRVATGHWRHTVEVRDVASGAVLQELEGHRAPVFSVAYSPDGRLLASASWDKTIRIWTTADGSLQQVFAGHGGEVSAVAFSADGRLLASASWDKTIRVWDVASGHSLRTLSGHTGAVYDVAFNPLGREIVSGAADGSVRVWSLDTGRPLRSLADLGEPVYGVCFCPEGRKVALATGDGKLRAWAQPTGEVTLLGSHGPRAYHLAIHPDGRRVASPSADGTLRIWNLDTGTQSTFRGHEAEVNFVRFSPDGRLVASTSDDGTVRLWSSETGRPLWRTSAFLPAPTQILTHRGWLRLTEGELRRFTPSPRLLERAVEQQALRGWSATDGRWVALATRQGTLQLWDRLDARLLWDRKATGEVKQLAISPSGAVLAAFEEGPAALFDRRGNRRDLALHSDAVAFGPDRIYVATERSVRELAPDGSPRGSRQTDVGVTAIGAGETWIAIGNEDGNVEISGAGPRRTVNLKQVSSSRVLHLFAGPKETVVVGYADGLFGLWSLRDGSLLASARLHGPVAGLALEDRHLVAASDLGDTAALDIGVFYAGYCDVLQEIWREVEVVFEEGSLTVRPPPADHRCRRRAN